LGYTLSIKGPADSTLYKVNEQTGLADKANSSPSSKIIPTMGTKENPLPIIGEDGSGGSFLGTWGYSMTNNLATGTFIGLNDAMTELTTKLSASGNGLTGSEATTTDTYPVYYGVSVAPTTEAGSYKLAESTAGAGDNVIVYQLTTPIGCNQYNIVYNGNGTTASPTTGSTTTSVATHDAPHTLTSNGFARTGYTFLGWSTASNATTAEYTNSQALTAEQVNSLVSGLNDGETKTLYAVWKLNSYRQVVQVRYENADGSWGAYNNVINEDRNHGATVSWSRAADTAYKAASITSYTVTGAKTTQVSVYRNTYTQVVQVRYENADGTWGAYSNVINAAYRYGATISWSRAQDTAWKAASITSYTVTAAKTSQASVSRRDYTVTWNGNGGSTPTAYTRNYGQAIGTLPSSSRANYVFAGWYNTSAASGGTAATTTTTVTGNVTYYARWTPVTIANVSYMQDMTSAACANTAVNTARTLTDRRDSKTYTIKKMADGKCWMTQNLRLVGPRTLTSADSNVSSNFALPASTNWSVPGYSSTGTAMLKDSGNTSYGVYYNWYTATAGTGTYNLTYGTASASVCPKGWHLPTSTEFQTLFNAYTIANLASTWTPATAGHITSAGSISTGRGASYWASNNNGNEYATVSTIGASLLNPTGSSWYSATAVVNYNKDYGLTVRCLAN
ncbi:InlB B-repeat-containing protein, partial [Candidatus Saccharibacteria bacterium]|nr:InlB B-repeat-containing protein [Candidatus Saccharibacteria bacterium]